MAVPLPETARRRTVREVLATFPETRNRVELLDGELIVSPPPTPRHQRVVNRLSRALEAYRSPLGLEETVCDQAADIRWDSDDLVQSDIFVVPPEEVTNVPR